MTVLLPYPSFKPNNGDLCRVFTKRGKKRYEKKITYNNGWGGIVPPETVIAFSVIPHEYVGD